jgi:hypothetical protein
MTNDSIQEKRATQRLRVFYGARIEGDEYAPALDSHIRCFSHSGARLTPKSNRRLPNRFDLRIGKFERVYRAEIVWRRGGDYGLKFIRERRLAPAIFERPAMESPTEGVAHLRGRFNFVEAR